MDFQEVTFSVNEYDYEGDIFNTGIFLHFGNCRILVAKNPEFFKQFVNRIVEMIPEIEENYKFKYDSRDV